MKELADCQTEHRGDEAQRRGDFLSASSQAAIIVLTITQGVALWINKLNTA